MSNEYDVIVIGGGPAGYPAAIRAAQNKLKVAIIDEWKNKDGTAVFGEDGVGAIGGQGGCIVDCSDVDGGSNRRAGQGAGVGIGHSPADGA